MKQVTATVALVAAVLVLSNLGFASDETPTANQTPVEIVIDANTDNGTVYNFWNVFPVTVQAPFKDEGQYEALRRSYPHAKYINCVRFLGGIKLEKDDYFRGVGEDGSSICDFTEAHALLAGIRRCGFTPWIVLDNVPAKLSEAPTKNRYGNTEPPADFGVWSSYVRQLVQSLVDEFGIEEVSDWRFRVGTEPDLKPGHWSGTKEDYLKHYDYTVAAVLSVIPDAKIGPGNIIDPSKKRKWSSWGPEIIDHCATGVNYATGKTGTRLTFFASSYYTNVGTSDERFDTLISMLRKRLDQYPHLANVPVEIQEFGVLSEDGKWIVGDGTHWGGSWMAHFANKIYENHVPRVYQWAWNTTKGGGIAIPVTHVLGMLESMEGSTRVQVKTSRESELDDIGCIAGRKGDSLDLILYRHLSVRNDGKPVPVRVIFNAESLNNKSWGIIQGSVIDPAHAGFVHEHKSDMAKAQAEMGEDANIYAIAFEVMAKHRDKYLRMSPLSQMETLPRLQADELGRSYFDLSLPGHSVVKLRLAPLSKQE